MINNKLMINNIEVPRVLHQKFLSYVPPREIVKVSLVSKIWNEIATEKDETNEKVEILWAMISDNMPEKHFKFDSKVEYYSNYFECSNNLLQTMKAYDTKNYLVKMIELIKSGADVNIADNYGETCLFTSLVRLIPPNYLEIMQLLLDNGANVNAKNSNENTPLFRACSLKYLEIVKFLLNNGADVNIANDNGETPLFEACRNGYSEIVKFLLNNGADVNIANKNHKTPLDIARKNGHTDIISFLEGKLDK